MNKNIVNLTSTVSRKIIALSFFTLAIIFSSGFDMLAQDFNINFYAGSDTVDIESIKVENLSNGTVYNMTDQDVLHVIEASDVRFFAETQNKCEIFPNPAESSFFINFFAESDGEVSISVFDIEGRQLMNEDFFAYKGYYKTEISGALNGLYFISIKGENYCYSGKIAGTATEYQPLKASVIQSVLLNSNQTLTTKSGDLYEMPYTYGDVLIFSFVSANGNKTIKTVVVNDPELIAMGDVLTLTVNFYTCKDFEDFEYQVVEIGDKVWMAENLNTEYFANDSHIKLETSDNTWQQLNTVAYCDYQNNPDNSDIYGKLYNWHAVDYSMGLCPQGWHVPTDAEWLDLEKNIGVATSAIGTKGWRGEPSGCYLKDAGTDLWSVDPDEQTNAAGFFALPAGMRTLTGEFQHKGDYAAWWTSTETDGQNAWCRALRADSCDIYREDGSKTLGLSVRCVYDNVQDTSHVIYTAPIVDTSIASNILMYSALISSEILSDGGAIISERGFVYGPTSGPVVESGNVIIDDELTDMLFSAELTGLSNNTVYYIRSFARNVAGISYGAETSFTTLEAFFTPGTGVTDVDGNFYPSVIISGKEYMADNLRTSRYNDNSTIEKVTIDAMWPSTLNGAYCWNENDSAANEVVYAKLYNFNAVGSSLLCPTGWHVLTDDDWKILEEALGMDNSQTNEEGWRGTIQGGYLKETGFDNWISPNSGATNQSGMNIKPGGYRDISGNFQDIGSSSYFWTLTENATAGSAYVRMLSSTETGVYRGEENKSKGCSVRCIKDFAVTATVYTNPVSEVLTRSVICGGEIMNDGGGIITEKGLIYGTSDMPDFTNYTGSIVCGAGIAWFADTIYGLSPTTTYNVRAYAINEADTSYGPQMTFTTLSEFFIPGAGVTDIDGNVYSSVIINGREYMAENLRTSRYNNGVELSKITDNAIWSTTISGAYSWYDNDSASYEILFGKLYNFEAACSTGICPTGWHALSDEDWKRIEIDLGMDLAESDNTGWRGDVQGGILKESGLFNWNSPNNGATNQSGIGGKPAGIRNSDGTFSDIGNSANFWTQTTNELSFMGYLRKLSYDESRVYRSDSTRTAGLSVRCVKDYVALPSLSTLAETEITTNSVICGGDVTDAGEGNIISKGLIYGITEYPDFTNFTGSTYSGNGLGAFSDTAIGLIPETTYYIRAYATNEAGTAYGSQMSFTTLPELFTIGVGVTDIDGNFYPTIIIGTTEYTTSNLRTSRYNDGSALLRVNNGSDWVTNSASKYCWYDDDSTANELRYGKLYNQYAVSGGNLCPSGWHVATDSEWKNFEFILGMSESDTSMTGWRGTDQGSKLKEYGTTNWTASNIGATNQSGYSAIGSGYRSFDGTFAGIGENFCTWTSSPDISFYSWMRKISNIETTVYRGIEADENGFSIRCTKTPPTAPVVVTGSITDISISTAVCYGNIAQDGYSEIIEKGIVWNTVGNPTLVNYSGITTEGSGSDEIMSVIYDLEPSTTYYIRTYATNAVGTSYGDETSFNTLAAMFAPGPGTSDPDGNAYETVIINNTEWMAENMRSQSFMMAKSGSAKDTVINETMYGRLYSAYELQQGGRCPAGWYFASESDWQDLENYLGMDEVVLGDMGWRGTTEGGMLKEPGFLTWDYPNTGATNETGLNFKAAGYFDENGDYMGEGEVCRYWTSDSESEEPYFYYARELSFNESRINRIASDPESMYYVRCVKSAALPTIITKELTVNEFFEHFSGGIIVLPGATAIYSKGVVWSTSPNPTLMDYNGFTDEGASADEFVSELYEINPGETYYLRAYATNNDGTAYGNIISFVGSASVQQMLDWGIRPLAIVNMGIPVDSLYGKYLEEGLIISIDADGGGLLCSTSDIGTAEWGCSGLSTGAVGTVYGMGLYNTLQIMDACLMSMIAAQTCRYYGSGSYYDWYMPTRDELLLMFQNSQYIAGISTTPYWTSTESSSQPDTYAVSISEGNIVEAPKAEFYNLRPIRHFSGDPVYDIDGNYYTVLRIGTQSWLSENLKTSRFQNGEPIYYAGNSTDWMLNTGNVSYCYPEDDSYYGLGYGNLYNYNVVTDPRNICPEGWHVPSDTEWDILVNFLGGEIVAGGKLKSLGDSFWATPNQSATNISNFGALPLGTRGETDGMFNYFYEHAYYWTSTPQDPLNSWYRSLQYDHGMVMHNTANVGAGMNIRCVKD